MTWYEQSNFQAFELGNRSVLDTSWECTSACFSQKCFELALNEVNRGGRGETFSTYAATINTIKAVYYGYSNITQIHTLIIKVIAKHWSSHKLWRWLLNETITTALFFSTDMLAFLIKYLQLRRNILEKEATKNEKRKNSTILKDGRQQ